MVGEFLRRKPRQVTVGRAVCARARAERNRWMCRAEYMFGPGRVRAFTYTEKESVGEAQAEEACTWAMIAGSSWACVCARVRGRACACVTCVG
jgi:hypothetical protein